MTVQVTEEKYEKMKTAYDAAYGKYGDYTDEQIDQLIDLKVRQQVSEWEREIGSAKLQEQVQSARAERDNRDAEAASKTYVELRRIMLEDSVSAPVIETDEDMEKLIKGE